MKKIIALLMIVASLGLAAYALLKPSPVAGQPLRVGVSAALSPALSRVTTEFRKELGLGIDLLPPEEGASGDLMLAGETEIARLHKSGQIREVIPVAKYQNEIIQAGVTSACARPSAALRFARYLAAPERGGRYLQGSALEPIPGDVWAEKPNLILYSGGVNRPAVEKLLASFAEREGIELTTVFNGCGILCAAMQTMADGDNTKDSSQFPDAYYACDLCFVPPVAEHFSEVVLLTETDIGIAVPKENPRQIKTLADLAQPGLKVGLCNQKQSTLGFMTAGILKSSGLENSIRKNLAVEVPTADFLITQLRSGALDAAIVYRVNAELQKEHLQFIKINHEGARAVQPFSVRGGSQKTQLAKRLQDHFLAHPESFTEAGFTWRGDQGVMKSSDIEIPEWLRKK